MSKNYSKSKIGDVLVELVKARHCTEYDYNLTNAFVAGYLNNILNELCETESNKVFIERYIALHKEKLGVV